MRDERIYYDDERGWFKKKLSEKSPISRFKYSQIICSDSSEFSGEIRDSFIYRVGFEESGSGL